MKKNRVKTKLKKGESSVGTWLSSSDPIVARLMAQVGFDWLTLNLEHMPIGIESASLSYAAVAESDVVPFARIAWNTGENIKCALDNGAWGVIVPMVCSRAEAELAVENTFYKPLGNRSVGGMLHAINFRTKPAQYYKKANDETLLIVQMEHVKAVENAEEILSVPGIDAFFVGPNDLLNSMGQVPDWDSDAQDFQDALKHLKTIARKYGVASGIHVASAEGVKQRIEEGFQFIALASELDMMLSKAEEIVRSLHLKTEKRSET